MRVHGGKDLQQTWSSQDLSLGLETSRDPFLQVLVSVLVLNLRVLVLVLGLETVLPKFDTLQLVTVTAEVELLLNIV